MILPANGEYPDDGKQAVTMLLFMFVLTPHEPIIIARKDTIVSRIVTLTTAIVMVAIVMGKTNQ